jgi:hypothetical protein
MGELANTPLGKWSARIEILKNLAEILGLMVAGYWAYWQFGLFQRPTLEPRLEVSSSLQWPSGRLSDPNYCLAQFGVDVSNKGKVPVDITTAHLRAWIVKSSPMEGYVDLGELIKGGRSLVDQTVTPETVNSHVGHYALDASLHNDYDFVLKKESGLPEAVFAFEATTAEGKDFQAFSWDALCPPPEKSSGN